MINLSPSGAARITLGTLFLMGCWLMWVDAIIVGLFFVTFAFFLIFLTNE